jgi:small subunit ribosomal protein S4
MKLFLKGSRCFTDKCAIERRNYPPGQHGQRRQKRSDYGFQLREKQKVKRTYGLLERQFRGYFHKAVRQKGVTGENLLQMLECRLDNIVYRMGFSPSRRAARQLVRHGHFLVNGRRVNVPSYLVKVGDEVALKEQSRQNALIQETLSGYARKELPAWIQMEWEQFKGKVLNLPTREEIALPVQEQLIVELYSK